MKEETLEEYITRLHQGQIDFETLAKWHYNLKQQPKYTEYYEAFGEKSTLEMTEEISDMACDLETKCEMIRNRIYHQLKEKE